MAKPMLVTLPFVLLLLDYWPLGRFGEIKPDHKIRNELFMSETSDKQTIKQTLESKKPADPEYKLSLIYPLLREKVPLFILAILSSFVTYIAQQKGGFVQSIEAFSLSVRIGNALISYSAYIGKMIWPCNLAVFYPHRGALVPWQVLGSVFILIAITSVVICRTKRSPYLATGWLWYIGILLPVIGIVQVGAQAMADRYTYIPLIGLFIIAAWGVPELLKKWNYRKEILSALSAISILCLSIITWTQVGYWQNNIKLYDHTLKVTDNNWLIYNNRGLAYDNLGNHKQAIEDYDKTIESKPGYADAYYNRGLAYNSLRNYKKAIEDYDRVIDINPGDADAYYNRGLAYQGIGNDRQAIEDYGRAIDIKPDFADAYYNRGVVYLTHHNISGCSDARKLCEVGDCQLLESTKGKEICH
jgi:hypothetical protein